MAGPSTHWLALVGPTASGKTEAAIAIAQKAGAEILSVDSMLVYRGMDIGTAKPTTEQRRLVRHHLIDVAEPSEAFSVSRFQHLAREAFAALTDRGSRALLVGGSGLYFRAVVDELEFPGTDPATRRVLEREAALVGVEPLHERLSSFDPAAAERIEPSNVRRTVRALEVAAVTGRPFSEHAKAWERFDPTRVRAAGVAVEPSVMRARIERRVLAMLDAGFLGEVKALVDRGLRGWLTSSRAIGYAEMARHLAGDLSLNEAIAGTVKRTRALARRQLAWFRRDPRIRWFEAGEDGASGISDDLMEYLTRE